MKEKFQIYEGLEPKIRELQALPGWASHGRCMQLANMVLTKGVNLAVEIGVFGGRATIAMALAQKALGRKGKTFAIDPWDAIASSEGQTGVNKKWWSDQRMHERVYGEFSNAVKEFEVEDYVHVIRKKSDEVELTELTAFNPNEPIGLLVIDGNHGPQAIKDVRKFANTVKNDGGIIYMDDMNWGAGGVHKAAEELVSAFGFQPLMIEGTGMYFMRTPASR